MNFKSPAEHIPQGFFLWYNKLSNYANEAIILKNTFIPRSWKVVNVPSISNLIEKTSDANGATETYFSGSNAGENLPSTMKSIDTSFSFYMMENLKTNPNQTVNDKKDRFVYKATDENGNTIVESMTSNLPNNATYIELKGNFEGYADKYEHNSDGSYNADVNQSIVFFP